MLPTLPPTSALCPSRLLYPDPNPAHVQTIMLLLGGFAIAAALSKHFIAKQLAVSILSRVGRKPHHVILANMLVATFASMWISNVAAPVLCFSLVQPILRTLPTSHPFCKSLVMGIALASNLGGMTSPISSPQNIFAIERMSMGGTPPSWLTWFAVALPVAFLGNIVCWALILMVYRPGETIKEVRMGDEGGGTTGGGGVLCAGIRVCAEFETVIHCVVYVRRFWRQRVCMHAVLRCLLA